MRVCANLLLFPGCSFIRVLTQSLRVLPSPIFSNFYLSSQSRFQFLSSETSEFSECFLQFFNPCRNSVGKTVTNALIVTGFGTLKLTIFHMLPRFSPCSQREVVWHNRLNRKGLVTDLLKVLSGQVIVLPFDFSICGGKSL